MRRLAHTLSGITLVGLVGALLTGCPVWSEDDGRSGMSPPPPADSGPIVRSCSVNSDCPAGYCASGRCTTGLGCASTAQCQSGFSCDSRHICVPGCTTNADCSTVASGLVCDPSSHACVPGGRCTTDANCASTPATPVCLGGSCQARTNQCQFDYQCTGMGQSCVDGRCVVGCTASNAATLCAQGQTCVSGRCGYPTTGSCATPCAAGSVCANGVCLRTCANDAACDSGLMCDNGVCRVDTRPRPFCTNDSGCNSDSICYNGACRRLCPMPTVTPDGDCMRVDVQFNLCRPATMGRSLCTSTNEVTPECARSSTCPAGRMCVNARCQ